MLKPRALEVARSLRLNKMPLTGVLYRKLSRGEKHEKSIEEWLLDNERDTHVLEHEDYNLHLPEKYYNRWSNSIEEEDVLNSFGTYVAEGDTVLDIGGHLGRSALTLRRLVGNSGRVIIFEPIPKWVYYLQQTTLDNQFENVTVENLVVGSNSGTISITIPSPETSQSTIRSQSDNGKDIIVNSITVENYLRMNSISSVTFAKIDVEGGEYDIICNSNAIRHIESAVIELHPHKIGIEKAKSVIETLSNEGNVTDLSGEDYTVDDLAHNRTSHICWESV